MNKEDVIDYLELIATKHKLIRHNPDTAQKFGYYEDLNTESLKKMKLRDFCMLPYQQIMQIRYADNGNEQYFATLPVHFEISKVMAKDDYKGIKQAQNEARRICESIWRKFLHDQRDRKGIFGLGPKVRFDGSFSFNDVEGGFENMSGSDLKFTLKWQVPGIDDAHDITQDFDN